MPYFRRGWIGLAFTSALVAQIVPVPTIPSIGGSATPARGNAPPSTGDLQRPIYVSGRVMLEGGAAATEQVSIEMVCGGAHRNLGYTDAKGRFSIDLVNRHADGSLDDASHMGSRQGGLGAMDGAAQGAAESAGTNGGIEMTLNDCDLQAVLPGYESERVRLANRHSGDNPDVGTLILHRRGNVQGFTISATSELAPKDARKAEQRGRALAKKGKAEEARRQFERAVQLYPRYAEAWYSLGLLEQQTDLAEARRSYAKALAADEKYVSPYQQLALLAARENKWDEVIDNSDHLLKLNPVDFPMVWFYTALGNYQLHRMEPAEKCARQGIAVDWSHRAPKLEQLLGIILAEKKDYPGAREHLEAYSHLVPEGKDKELVKRQLQELNQLMAGPDHASQTPVRPSSSH